MSDRLAWVCEHGSLEEHSEHPDGDIRMHGWCPGPTRTTDGLSDAVETALRCLDALSEDATEPERYREWYAEAALVLRGGTQ